MDFPNRVSHKNPHQHQHSDDLSVIVFHLAFFSKRVSLKVFHSILFAFFPHLLSLTFFLLFFNTAAPGQDLGAWRSYMPSLRRYFTKYANRLPQHTTATLLLTALASPAIAATGGLAKAQSTLQMIKDNLELILPIAAVIIGLIIVVLYMAEIMRKDDMVRWLIGLVIAGSIGEIVVMLWK
jgi:hypothetical protein